MAVLSGVACLLTSASRVRLYTDVASGFSVVFFLLLATAICSIACIFVISKSNSRPNIRLSSDNITKNGDDIRRPRADGVKYVRF